MIQSDLNPFIKMDNKLEDNEAQISADDKSPSKVKSPLSIDSSNVKSKKLSKNPSYVTSNLGGASMKCYEPVISN